MDIECTTSGNPNVLARDVKISANIASLNLSTPKGAINIFKIDLKIYILIPL